MDVANLTEELRLAGGWLPGKRVALDFGAAGAILLDGVAATIGAETAGADATVTVGWSDWLAIRDGTLDPMSAYLSGRLRIAGDLGAAMQLAALLARLGS